MILPRKTVLEIDAYSPPLEGRRGLVRLDFNENTSSPEEIGAYPEYARFMEILSERLSLPKERLILTNGTGEAISLIAVTFIEPGLDRALTSNPTFALIPHNLKLVGAKLTQVPSTEDWRFDIEKIEDELKRGVKLAFFASPDNPIGALLTQKQVRDWCQRYPETLFAIDEAYAEYGGESSLPLAGLLPNLLVLRTFSKAWGMAGLRLGAIGGDQKLIDHLLKVRAPYSVNVEALRRACELFAKSGKIHSDAKELLMRRPPLLAYLNERGFRTSAGGGNFFLIMAGADAAPLCNFLRQRKILIRDQSSKAKMEGIVRVTVGTDEENRLFLKGIGDFRKSRALIFDLDDTLVDTSKSYDETVTELVKRYSKTTLERTQLAELRSRGGFNDDWDAAFELLRQRSIDVLRSLIEKEGKEIYLALARDREQLMFDENIMKELAKRFRLFIFTGRPRDEYEPVWGERLTPLFEKVYCKDDFAGICPKPAPNMLKALLEKEKLAGGYYVGNSIDDVRCAKGAKIRSICVNPSDEADLVIKTVNDLKGVFLL